MLSGTDFGHLWVGRAVIALLVLVLALVRAVSSRSERSVVLLILSGAFLASLAGTGHTQSSTGATKLLQMGSDAVHLLAAGGWLGGLVPLALVSARGSRAQAEQGLARFSGMGYAAVAALFATGVINGVILVGTWANLFGSPYGRLLLVKIALFLGMVGFAGINRFFLVPALVRNGGVAENGAVLARLRRHIAYEQLLGATVIGIVSVLGTLAPPATAAM
jgi:putative copper resistance protein D